MLSSVLRSRRAVQMNIATMRAFVRLRGVIMSHKEVAATLTEVKHQLAIHDIAIREIV